MKLSGKKKHRSIDCQKEKTVRSPLAVYSCIAFLGIPKTLTGMLFLFFWCPLCSFSPPSGYPCPSPTRFFLKSGDFSLGSCYTLGVQKASPHGWVEDSSLLSSGSIHNRVEKSMFLIYLKNYHESITLGIIQTFSLNMTLVDDSLGSFVHAVVVHKNHRNQLSLHFGRN